MASNPRNTIFTIGHSNHSQEEFLELLRGIKVNAIADVRSAPHSRYIPHFNREAIKVALEETNIRYVYLGNELGGRSDDQSCYEDGRVRYDRLERTDSFQSALVRLIQGSRDYRISIMCAEKEPLECHRTLLISHALVKRGYVVEHILACGRRESHADTMTRLLHLFELGDDAALDLFTQSRPRPRNERIQEAIRRQNRNVGHDNSRVARAHGGRVN